MREPEVCIHCNCGAFHLLHQGLDIPVYWCGDNLMELVAGDVVEYMGVARIMTDSRLSDLHHE